MRRILFKLLVYSFMLLYASGFNILFGDAPDKKEFVEYVKLPIEEETPEKKGPGEERKEQPSTPSAQAVTVGRTVAAPVKLPQPPALLLPKGYIPPARVSSEAVTPKAPVITPKAKDDPQKKLSDLESERNNAYRYLEDKNNPDKYAEAVKFGWIRSIQDIEKDIETQKKEVAAMPRTAPMARVDTPTAARAPIDVEREMGLALRRELSATEVFEEKNVRQIEEASSIKEVMSLSDEQKQFVARLSYQVAGRLEQMSDEMLKSIPAEQRIILLRLMRSRAIVINSAKESVKRSEGLIKDLQKTNPEKALEEKAKSSADAQKLFALTPGRTSLSAVLEDTDQIDKVVARLGSESGLHLEIMDEAKRSLDELSKKKTLNRREKEKLEDARNKLFSNFIVLNNADLSPEQSMRALKDCRELVEKNPTKAKSFLSELAKKQKKLDSQVAKIDSKMKRISKTKQYKTLMRQVKEMNELADQQRLLMADKSLSEQERRNATVKMQEYAAKYNESFEKANKLTALLSKEREVLVRKQKNLHPQIEAFKVVINKKKYEAELAKLEKEAIDFNAEKFLEEKSSTISEKREAAPPPADVKAEGERIRAEAAKRAEESKKKEGKKSVRQAPDAPELPAR